MTLFKSTDKHLSSSTFVFFREDYKNSLLWGFNFAVGALPNVLAEKEEDVADMEEFFSSTIDKEAFEELMKKEQEKVTKSDVILERLSQFFLNFLSFSPTFLVFPQLSQVTKSDVILERLGDLWDEMVEAGAI